MACKHLANISCRLGGRQVRQDGAAETIRDDPEARAMLDPPRRQGYELPEAFRA